MRGFDLWLQQSRLVPVDGRLQGVVLPLAICSAVELAGSTKQWLDWHLSEMLWKGFLHRVGNWTNRSKSNWYKKVE